MPRLEMSHILLLALLTGLLALLWWHRAVSSKVPRLPTVVTRKQIGAYPRLLHPDLLLALLRNRMSDCPLRLCVLGWPIPPRLLWLVLKRGSLWARLYQMESLRSAARRSRCRRLPLLLCLVSQVCIFLNNSPIDKLTESVEFEHCQAILELAAKPLPEARLFLLISVYMITSILG